ncbi:hypothetical protein KIN20_000839 [Parelaphostrongylus tenuis]|uniref:Uncharacterized protein n=1 Tax=Parelaphostrongylus tenuis TaxID=148309 RepID=A0AAD5MBU0_PARTN|nr:hypothetical protein KIN20_000839 [Parelaphostrongylus tenuis]
MSRIVYKTITTRINYEVEEKKQLEGREETKSPTGPDHTNSWCRSKHAARTTSSLEHSQEGSRTDYGTPPERARRGFYSAISSSDGMFNLLSENLKGYVIVVDSVEAGRLDREELRAEIVD